ncbi:MAG: hypothetical protein K8H88_24300, partial [Sandaracinaceae bacterium]|nr:hypothetical protein [Sandaracinaceae bacterium]
MVARVGPSTAGLSSTGVLLCLLLGAAGVHRAAAQTTVSFDSPSAPCTLPMQTSPISAYTPGSITFSMTTMEVVNQCGNFGVSGHSAPNFLAWSVPAGAAGSFRATFNGGTAFSLSLRVGSSSAGNVTFSAFDSAGTLIWQTTRFVGSTLTTISFPTNGIAYLDFSTTLATGVVDDITYTLSQCGNGVREGTEQCDNGGISGCCTASCTFMAPGQICRLAAGPCDVAEACPGGSGECPVDGLASAGSVCRGSAGVCDPQELCSGASAACPPDARHPSTFECRASAGACDVADFC